MTKFRLNKSFEEELASKANEFRMEPSASMWESIESSIPKKQSLLSWKTAIGTSAIISAIILSFLVPFKQKESIEVATPNSTVTPNIISSDQAIAELPLNANQKAITIENASRKAAFIDVSNHVDLIEAETQISKLDISPLLSYQSHIGLPESELEYDKTLVNIEASLPKKSRKLTKFQDGLNLVVSISPQYSYRTLAAKNDIGRPVVNQREKLDEAINNINFGLSARYYFSNKLSLSVGFNYGSWGENIGLRPGFKNYFYDSLAHVNGYNSEEIYQPGKEFKHKNQYTHLEIPIILSTDKALWGRFSLSMSAGVALTYTQTKKCVMYDYQMHHYVNNKDLIRNWNASLLTSLKLQYKIENRWTLITGPELRYGFLSTYRDSYPMSQHQYGIGWNFGLQWKIFGNPKSIWSK